MTLDRITVRGLDAVVLHILAIWLAGIANGQTRTNLVEAETDRVFNGLGPAVQVLGQPYETSNIDARMRDENVPGLSVALIENDEIRWVRAFGIRDRSTSLPVEPDTRFMVKSLSKPVAAFAAMRLADSGAVALDEPIQTYLRRWTVPGNEYTQQRSPTLRLILSHSAGFTLYGVPSYTYGEDLPNLIQALNGEPPAKPAPVAIDYVPGTRTRYSGGGYSVLQLMIEEVTAQPFPEAMRALVLDSVGMSHSLYYPGVPASLQRETAAGHGTDGRPIEGKWERIVQMAAGGLISTASDMASFVIAVNTAWQGQSHLLPVGMARTMLQPNADGWGLGFEVSGEGSRIMYSHSGAGDGFRSIMVGFPAIRKGAVILTNSDAGSEIRYEILRALSNEYVWPAFRIVRRATIPLDAGTLRSCTGRYEYSDGSSTVVTIDSTGLVATWKDTPPVALYPASDSLFFSLSNEEYEFRASTDGIPSKLTWRGSFGSFDGTRQP